MFSTPAIDQQIVKPTTRLFHKEPRHFSAELSFSQQGRQVSRVRLTPNTPHTSTYTGMKFCWVHSFRYFAPEGKGQTHALRRWQQYFGAFCAFCMNFNMLLCFTSLVNGAPNVTLAKFQGWSVLYHTVLLLEQRWGGENNSAGEEP